MTDTKFGDFFDDEIIEVDSIDEENVEYHSPVPSSSIGLPSTEPKSEQQVQSAIEKLSEKYNLDLNNVSVKDALDNIDNINSDDGSFDLVASKIVTDYVGRISLRGVIAEANMIDKVLTLMDNTPIQSVTPDTLLLVSKALEYQDKLFSYLDRYKKAGINTSLKHISENKKSQEDKEKDRISLSHSELREIINELRKDGGDNET